MFFYININNKLFKAKKATAFFGQKSKGFLNAK